MINRQVKEWLDKVQLPVGERVLTKRLLDSFLASPLGSRKDYSRQYFNSMLKQYANDLGWSVTDGCSYMGKYMVFNGERLVESKHISADRLIHDTCGDFYDWAVAGKKVEYGDRVRPKELMKRFIDEQLDGYDFYTNNSKKTIQLTTQEFGKWLVRLNYFTNGRPPVEGRNGQGKWLILI